MDVLRKVLDATIGRVLRWAGRQWAAGAGAGSRQTERLDDLAAGVGEVLSESRSLGRGLTSEWIHVKAIAAADGRLAAAATAIDDDELHEALTAFREAAKPYAERRSAGYNQAALEAAFEAVLARIRALHAMT